MPARAARLPIALLVAALLGACTGEPPLPPAGELLRDATRATRQLRTVRFSLQVDGGLGVLAIRRAEGVLTREEGAGTLQIEASEQTLIEYEVVIADESFYLKGPTGGFQRVPSFLAERVYDPTGLLDPDEGLASMLATARQGRTEAAESVGGRAGYRVRARLRTDVLRPLLPLAEGQEEVPGVLWIEEEARNLLRARLQLRQEGAERPTVLTVTLSEFNAPADIEPPP